MLRAQRQVTTDRIVLQDGEHGNGYFSANPFFLGEGGKRRVAKRAHPLGQISQ